ncbi:septum site-determining protein MinC [Acetobacter suratthaniensis]|nr:septum site-determining protein MinC [Acetobacter suratthaniensis]MCX2565116.1 septum site-determining protein MinC [Acetobacter suratthaniensis]
MSGRTFVALTLTPESPLTDWLTALDQQIARSVGFFTGKPVIVDLSMVQADTPDLSSLPDDLRQRGIRIIGIEGGSRDWPATKGWDWPESPTSARTSPTPQREAAPSETDTDSTTPAKNAAQPMTLVVEESIRSGQQVIWPEGDVVVMGAVASGAEVSAGGSIHIYGALRGRAVAGIGGRGASRVFTKALDAELVAIDGFYATAEEMDPTCASGPTQILLEGERLVFRAMPG